MSPFFSKDFSKNSSTVPANVRTITPASSTVPANVRTITPASSTAASLRRHAILADLNVLQVATLMGTALLVALGVALGGRSYITTVSPDGLISSQPGAYGSNGANPAETVDDSSPAAM